MPTFPNALSRIDDAGFGDRIRYTAYVDGIDVFGVTVAERQKPPGSPIHDSFYQRVDPALRGNSTTEQLEGLEQTTYDSLADFEAARDGGTLTPVSNVNLSDEIGGLFGQHMAIDGYVFGQRLYVNRSIEIVNQR